MATASYLADRMLELLTAAENALTLARTGNPIPDRVGRTHSRPVAEQCNGDGQLYVYLGNPSVVIESIRAPSASQGNVHWVPKARFYVELWRCSPPTKGHATPTAAQIDAFTARLAQDGWALVTGLEQSYLQGLLFPGALPAPPVGARPNFGTLIPLGPQGSVGGWQMLVELPINDPGP